MNQSPIAADFQFAMVSSVSEQFGLESVFRSAQNEFAIDLLQLVHRYGVLSASCGPTGSTVRIGRCLRVRLSATGAGR
jgi:hypothetical protein